MRLGPGDYAAAARVLLAPGVKEHLSRMTPEKILALLGNPRAYVLLPNPGCVIIAHRLLGTGYQVHQATLPEVRGRATFIAYRDCIQWLLKNTEATVLVGFTPATLRGAVLAACAVGFKRVGVIPGAFSGTDAIVTAITRATLEKGPEGGTNA